MQIESYFNENEWQIVAQLETEPRSREVYGVEDLDWSDQLHSYIRTTFPDGLFLHQKEGLKRFLNGNHVCLTTSTASGKTEVFFAAAAETLVKDASARILCVYPLRALAREQEARWKKFLGEIGLNVEVGRIDGSVKPLTKRPTILANSRVIVCTPDIIHAWLLSNLADREVRSFLASLRLMVIDEIHTYTGVFGSNSAFLFRRLQHLMHLLDAQPQVICTSATIANPLDHLRNLFGLEFSLVDREWDTSPAYGHDIYLVNPPGLADFLSEVALLLRFLSKQDSSRFIAFVDSRKQVELISAILARADSRKRHSKKVLPEEEVDEPPATGEFRSELLDELDVLPYRAGLEEWDRRRIQQRLTSGSLNGVVSTSALELGIDIGHLDTCVLIGVPNSQTSLYQRIGRVGRKQRGTVIVLNTGTIQDEAVFRDPQRLLDRPLAEGALYLHNEYIQYIHALCLSRLDGEHDILASFLNLGRTADFSSSVEWPQGFAELCNMERTGQIPRNLQVMKAEAGDNPNYVFPLRDVGSQFRVQWRRMRDLHGLGSLSFSQLMREAYPGAVYYYAAEPYRVTRVRVRSREIDVRKEKYYITRPISLPTLVFPNLTEDNIHRAIYREKLLQVECNLQIRESIAGFKERRGPNEFTQEYPIPVDLNIHFDQRYFTRTYFSTGVVIAHPALNAQGVEVNAISQLIYEAFLICIPFERQDIDFTSDRFRTSREPWIRVEDRFIAVFDQTYGSLRLSGRLMNEDVILHVLLMARELAEASETDAISPETLIALDCLIESANSPPSELPLEFEEVGPEYLDAKYAKVIKPGSKGLNLNRDNEEFTVERVFLTREGLRYAGITETHAGHLEKTECMPFVSEVIEIPGVTEYARYNYETGEVEETTG